MPNFLDLLLNGQGSNPVATNAEAGLGITAAQTPQLPVPGQEAVAAATPESSLTSDIGNALLGFSAGTKGGFNSFLAQRALLQQRQAKSGAGTVELQGIQAAQKAIQETIKTSESFQGENKAKFLNQNAERINAIVPQAGNALIALSRQPDIGELIAEKGQNSPTLQSLNEFDPSGQSAMKLLGTSDGIKTVVKELEVAELPAIRRKLQSITANAQQLVPEAMWKEALKDNVVSEADLVKFNEHILNHPNEKFRKIGLTDRDLRIARNNTQATFGTAGVLAAEGDQEVLKSKAKQGFKAGQTFNVKDGKETVNMVFDPNNEFPGGEDRGGGFKEIGRGATGGDTNISFPTSSGFGEKEGVTGRFVTKKDGTTEFSPDIKPVPKAKDPISEEIARAIREARGGEGKPKKDDELSVVPPEVQQSFDADPKFKGKTIGALTEKGYEVLDKKTGKLLGHIPLQ